MHTFLTMYLQGEHHTRAVPLGCPTTMYCAQQTCRFHPHFSLFKSSMKHNFSRSKSSIAFSQMFSKEQKGEVGNHKRLHPVNYYILSLSATCHSHGIAWCYGFLGCLVVRIWRIGPCSTLFRPHEGHQKHRRVTRAKIDDIFMRCCYDNMNYLRSGTLCTRQMNSGSLHHKGEMSALQIISVKNL